MGKACLEKMITCRMDTGDKQTNKNPDGDSSPGNKAKNLEVMSYRLRLLPIKFILYFPFILICLVYITTTIVL